LCSIDWGIELFDARRRESIPATGRRSEGNEAGLNPPLSRRLYQQVRCESIGARFSSAQVRPRSEGDRGHGNVQLDDVVIVALVLRSLLRSGGESLVREHWPPARERARTRAPPRGLNTMKHVDATSESEAPLGSGAPIIGATDDLERFLLPPIGER
jgi:hypothetical protein